MANPEDPFRPGRSRSISTASSPPSCWGSAGPRRAGRRPPSRSSTPVVRALKAAVESLTERLRKPYPHAAETLAQLRAAGLTLYVLTSRADERIAAAERWLDRRGWRGSFERLFFNVDGEDADAFKAGILRAHPVDIHVDDDPGTIAQLAPLFPDMLFVHLDHERGRSPGARTSWPFGTGRSWPHCSGSNLHLYNDTPVGPAGRSIPGGNIIIIKV